MRENTDQENSEYGHSSRSENDADFTWWIQFLET